ncbi:MAG: hypothetical protein KDD56_02925 [Bdellovibrionales bacterium]|nr:hypothetical protein [Bdellovibrionales bacterium]
MMSKKARANLQRDMDKVLANLDARWLNAASSEVVENLNQLLDSISFSDVDNILAWISHFPGEVDLTSLIEDQLSKRQVFLPRVIGRGEMEFVKIDYGWQETFEQGFKNIPGPPAATSRSDLFNEEMASKSLIIIPGLAFDPFGNWIGRSFGYYNKFLVNNDMRKAIKVGVCWSMQIIEQAPPDPFDVYLDFLCTEEQCISTDLSHSTSELFPVE